LESSHPAAPPPPAASDADLRAALLTPAQPSDIETDTLNGKNYDIRSYRSLRVGDGTEITP
jgi:hypothetical protein